MRLRILTFLTLLLLIAAAGLSGGFAKPVEGRGTGVASATAPAWLSSGPEASSASRAPNVFFTLTPESSRHESPGAYLHLWGANIGLGGPCCRLPVLQPGTMAATTIEAPAAMLYVDIPQRGIYSIAFTGYHSHSRPSLYHFQGDAYRRWDFRSLEGRKLTAGRYHLSRGTHQFALFNDAGYLLVESVTVIGL